MSIFELFKYNLFLNYVFYVEISPGCSLEGLVLKLKLQHFGHLMRRVDSLEKTLMLGGIGHLAPLMRPTKFPEIPVSLERNTEVFRHPLL